MADWVQETLKKLRNRDMARQGHKNQPIQYTESDFFETFSTIDNIKAQLLKQYPVLQTYLDKGFIFESLDPLVMRHKDCPYGTE
jgi:hypothetical protein